MSARREKRLKPIPPNLQISFHHKLQAIKQLYLGDALKGTVAGLDVGEIDSQLSEHVCKKVLAKVASFGLRGELFFAVPCILNANPLLLGYYRLLLGFSQKEFYSKGPFGRFKRLEERGDMTASHRSEIKRLCRCLSVSAETLVDGIDHLDKAVVNDLQLLTVGPQLRGSENTRVGQDATKEVFGIISGLVSKYVKEQTENSIAIRNDSGRSVLIEFFADPDVKITEILLSGVRPLLSIEIKGGKDVSNIHNRIGEAEKSHQKARNLGFFEFWTIIRVKVDIEKLGAESPTTSHFFHLDKLADAGSDEGRKFRELLASMLGIRAGK